MPGVMSIAPNVGPIMEPSDQRTDSESERAADQYGLSTEMIG
jgi:hypothetical protein